MMTTTALIEHLGAALHACGEGDVEQALSYVLAIYEEGHYQKELSTILGQRRDVIVSSPNDLRAKLEDLRVRAREQEESSVSRGDEMGELSLSDFFDEAPMHSEVFDDEMKDSEDELVSMGDDQDGFGKSSDFSFADLGGELSFENLNFNFDKSGAESSEAVDLLDDIWPEDELSMLDDVEESSNPNDLPSIDDFEEPLSTPKTSSPQPEQGSDYQGFFDELDDQAHWFSNPPSAEPDHAFTGSQESSVAFELVEIDPVDRSGVTGRSETNDEDIFNVFSSNEQSASEPPESVSSSPSFLPPTHHEPEPSPSLSFSFDFDEDVSEHVEPNRSTPPVEEREPEKRDEPVETPVAPPTHRQDERAPSLGFGDLSFDSILEEEAPSRPASKLPLPPKIEPPTRQVDLEGDEIASLLTDVPSEPQHSPSPFKSTPPASERDEMSRETRSMPAVDRDLVNPFASSHDDGFGGADWSFDEGPAAMPGLNDDWLEQEQVPEDHVPSHMRDVHNDATAIPGLNSSNSGLPFNPYRHEGERSRHPSTAPHTKSSPGSSTNSGFMRGDRSPPPQSLAASSSLRQTRENQEIYKDEEDSREEHSPHTQEHDYEQFANMLKDTQERNQPAPVAHHTSTKAEPEEEEDPFDLFDLGFQAPRIEEVHVDEQRYVQPEPEPKRSPPPVVEVEDYGSVKSTMFGAPFIAPPARATLDDMPTPLPPAGSSSAAEDMTEDEFFALAESIAAENSVAFEAASPEKIEVEDAPTHQGDKARARLDTAPVSNSGLKPPPNPFHAQSSTGLKLPTPASSSHAGSMNEDELAVDRSIQEDRSSEARFNKAQIAYDMGRFEDALELAIPLKGGEFDGEARQLIVKIEEGLERSQLERIGPLSRTPVLDVPLGQLSTLDLDHRAGFLLSQIDGFLTFEDLLDLSAMPRLETIVVLADLLDRAIIKTI